MWLVDDVSSRHPVFARFYAWLRPRMDDHGGAQLRRRLLAGLSGSVVEVGAGDGGNLAHYPSEVASVLAVEPEPYLRARAEAAAGRVAVPVRVVHGLAERLPVADADVDAAVASLVLCSVTDQSVALAELYRVVRPGGELRFLEHVLAPPDRPRMRRTQHGLDSALWPRLFAGCHCGRDTASAIEAAGFTVAELEEFVFPEGASMDPTGPCVLGRAIRR